MGKRKAKHGMNDAERDRFRTLWNAAHEQTCARCGKLGTRIGMQDEELVVDVLCYRCFENAPHRFKLSPGGRAAQDVYRDAIKAGAHPRFAARAAEVHGQFSWYEER